jgi:hypothetical protein
VGPLTLAAFSPSLVPLLVVGVAVLVAATGLVILMAKPSDPGPADVAVAYEQAWDRLDFATLWALSSPRLRDGRSKTRFVRDKEEAYRAEGRGLRNLISAIRPERVEINGSNARVDLRLELRDGQELVDEMLLERDGTDWRVVAYHVAGRRPPSPS